MLPPFFYAGARSLRFLSMMFSFCAIFDKLLWSIYDLLIIFSLLSCSLLRNMVFLSRWNLYCCVDFTVPFSFCTLSFQLIYFLLFHYYNREENTDHVSLLTFPVQYTQYQLIYSFLFCCRLQRNSQIHFNLLWLNPLWFLSPSREISWH